VLRFLKSIWNGLVGEPRSGTTPREAMPLAREPEQADSRLGNSRSEVRNESQGTPPRPRVSPKPSAPGVQALRAEKDPVRRAPEVRKSPRPVRRMPPLLVDAPDHSGPRRRFHIGLDWGTSASKMVIRELDHPSHPQGAAYVVELDGGGVRYPSTVVLAVGRLWFGHEAEKRRADAECVWDSLKARAGVGNEWEKPACSDLTLQDLVTLSLAHLVFQSQVRIDRIAEMRGCRPRVGSTVSVPTDKLRWKHSRYLQCVLSALLMATRTERFDPQGCSLVDAARMLSRFRPSATLLERAESQWDRYLRAEVVAAMLWLHELPQVGSGAWGLVDIGAATIHASFFRIHHTHDPDGKMIPDGALSVFGAATAPAGMDKMAELLIQLGIVESVAEVRGRETQLLGQVAAEDSGPVLEAMQRPWKKADRHARIADMCTNQTEHLTTVVVGGGSKLQVVRECFEGEPIFLRDRIRGVQPLRGNRHPDDLYELPVGPRSRLKRVTADPSFLMVAYGLSLPLESIPEVTLPEGISQSSTQMPRRDFVSFEEHGFG